MLCVSSSRLWNYSKGPPDALLQMVHLDPGELKFISEEIVRDRKADKFPIHIPGVNSQLSNIGYAK